MTESPRSSEMARLIEKSSLGTTQARALRDLTDPSVVDRILNAETEVSATKPSTEPTPWTNLGQTSDRELAERFAAGDEEAVRAVYDRYAGPVLTVAMATLGRRDLADEVVVTTMLKAWRGTRSFDSAREFAPWIYAIARRVAFDIYRRESRASAPSELGDDNMAAVPLSFGHTWEAGEVRSSLDKLPADEREVVRLSQLEGMTVREVADHVGVPIGTVKSRLSRGHRRLAAMLRTLDS